MYRKFVTPWGLVLALIFSPGAKAATMDVSDAGQAPLDHDASPAEKQKIMASLAKLPLAFEANIGQAPTSAKFVARQGQQNVYLEANQIRWTLPVATEISRDDMNATASTTRPPSGMAGMYFDGARSGIALEAQNKLTWETNYFVGNDAKRWSTGVQNFARVTYKEVYPGIDVAFYGNGKQIEYDFIVAPGAKTDAIRLGFTGVDHIALSPEGDLILKTGATETRQLKPIVYQELNGKKQAVTGEYKLLGDKHVAFALGNYDAAKTLVIDPIIVTATYYGTYGEDEATNIVIDKDGSHVIAGHTTAGYGTEYGYVANGAKNVFVAKLSADGSSLIYSAMLAGSYYDEVYKLILDEHSNPILVGRTGSADFPTVNAYQSTLKGIGDAFVAKISADGRTLLFSTYFGGSNTEQAYTAALDIDGGIYFAGYTGSYDFPLVSPIQAKLGTAPMFISKFASDGRTLVFSTFLGCQTTEYKQSQVHDMAIDASGNIYMLGLTECSTFPVVNPARGYAGAFDLVLFKMRPDHTFVYSTFLGGSSNEDAYVMALNTKGEVIVSGITESTDFPVSADAPQKTYGGGGDAFFAKLSAEGSRFTYATYWGGNGYERPWGVAVDKGHNAYFTGWTNSPNFPKIDSINTSTVGSYYDAFVVVMNPEGSTAYLSSVFGGIKSDYGYDIAVNDAGQIIVIGVTNAADFPVSPNAFDKSFDGVVEGFVATFSKLELAPVALTGPELTVNEGDTVILDGTQSYDPNGDAITSYTWTQIAGPVVALDASNTKRPSFIAPDVPTGGATLTFQLVVSDGNLTSTAALVNITVKNVNHAPVADAGMDQTVTEGSAVNLTGEQSYDSDNDTLSFTWEQVGGPSVILSNTNSATPNFTAPLVTSAATLQFALTVSDGSLTATDRVDVVVENVNHAPLANAGVDQTVAEGSPVTLDGVSSSDPDNDAITYSWNQLSGSQVVLSDTTSATPQFQAPQVNLGGDTLVFSLQVNDGELSSIADTIMVTVLDLNDPPACERAQPSAMLLWPPNHKLMPIAITGVSDPNDDQVILTINKVTQDEPVSGLGDGDTAPDAVIQEGQVSVRAERSAQHNGRIYTIHFTANDDQGGSCAGTVTLGVPKDKLATPVDSGQDYDATKQ